MVRRMRVVVVAGVVPVAGPTIVIAAQRARGHPREKAARLAEGAAVELALPDVLAELPPACDTRTHTKKKRTHNMSERV